MPVSTSASVRFALFSLAACTIGGCGPAGIAVGVGSLGGGGGGGVLTPSVSQIGTDTQPNPNITQITFNVDRAARVTLSYAVAGVVGETSVGASSLTDGNGNPLAPVDSTANGLLVWNVPAGDQTLRWLHAQDLGRTEERGVSLFLGTANADGDGSDSFDRRALLQNTRVGRENGIVTVQTVVAAAREGDVTVRTSLSDRAGDLDITFFDLEWRVTGPQGPTPWSQMPRDPGNRYPTGVVPVETSAGAPVAGQDIETAIDLTVDTLAPLPDGLGIPRMRYDELEVRITWREVHSPSGGFGTATLADLQAVGSSGTIALGTGVRYVLPPEIPDAPGFLVPIELLVENPSRFPSTYTFSGTYTFDDGTPGSQGGPTTLARNDPLTLGPGERRVHFIVWDALGDVGLGLIPAVQNVQVGVTVTAALESTGTGLNIATVSDPSGARPIETRPFVTFDTPLVAEGADRLFLQRDDAARTQQLFVQEFPTQGSNFSSQISVDQQFAPIQITGLLPWDAGQGSGGLLQVIPTNFSSAPNCVVFQSSGGQVTYLDFSEELPTGEVRARNGGMPVTTTGSYNAQSTSPGMPPLSMELGTARAAVAFNYNLSDTPSPTTAVEFYLLTEDPTSGNPAGSASAIADETRDLWPPYFEAAPAERNWRYPIFAVAGDFDTDPDTATVVLAEKSCFHTSGTGAPLGFMDVYAFRDQGGTITGATVQRIPTDGIRFPAGAQPYVTNFDLSSWQDPDDPTALTGLFLKREFFDPATGSIRYEAFTISRDASGAWNPQWTRLMGSQDLGQLLDFNQYSSGRVFALDLDRDGQVDPLVAVNGRDFTVRFPSGNGFGDFRLSDNNFRYTLSTTNSDPNVEAVLRDVATSGTVYSEVLRRNPAELTVWEDPAPATAWINAGFPDLELILRDTSTSTIVDQAPLREAQRGRLNFYVLANPTNSGRVWRKGLETDLQARDLGVPPPGCNFNSSQLLDLIDVNGDRNLDLVFQLSDCEPTGGGASDPFDQQIIYLASALSGVAQDLETDFGTLIEPSRQPGFLDLDRDGRADLISRGALYLGTGSGRFQAGVASGFVGGSDTQYWLEQVLPVPAVRLAGPTLDITAFTNTPGVPKRIAVDTIILGDAQTSTAPTRFTGRSVPIAEPITTIMGALRPAVRAPGQVPSQGIAKDLAAVMDRDGAGQRLYRLTYDIAGQRFTVADQLQPDLNLIPDLAVVRVGDLGPACDITHNEAPQDLFVASTGDGGSVYWLPVDAPGGPWSAPQVLYTARATESIHSIDSGLVDGDHFEDLTIVTAETTGGEPIYRVYLLPQAAGSARFRPLTESDLALRFEVAVGLGAQAPVAWGVDPYRDSLANGVLVSATEIRVLRPELDGSNLRLSLVRSPIEVGPTLTLTPNTGVVATDFDLDGIPEVLGGVPGSAIFRVSRERDR